jgi:predicted lipase
VMLYSVSDLQGYTIHAADGDIGTLRTLYFDEEEWGVENVVVDTGTWITGKHVLVSPEVLGQPDPNRKHLPVSLSQEEIKDCPEINTHETAPGPSYRGDLYAQQAAHLLEQRSVCSRLVSGAPGRCAPSVTAAGHATARDGTGTCTGAA